MDTGTLFNIRPFLLSLVVSARFGFVSLNQSHGFIIFDDISLELLLPDMERLNSYIF